MYILFRVEHASLMLPLCGFCQRDMIKYLTSSVVLRMKNKMQAKNAQVSINWINSIRVYIAFTKWTCNPVSHFVVCTCTTYNIPFVVCTCTTYNIPGV